MSAPVHQALLAFEDQQALQGPAEAIAGLQDIVVEELLRLGNADISEDAGRVQTAARDLLQQVTALAEVDGEAADRGRLRHDLRTPINAIIGYTELMLEDVPDIPAPLREDMDRVLSHAAAILDAIDQFLGKDVEIDPSGPGESDMFAALKRDLESGMVSRQTEETGEILVIDDTPANLDLLRRQLQRQGHSVATAISGHEGLAALEARLYDLVIVDVIMPDLNGIELLGRIKASAIWRDIPVIVVSGLRDVRAVTRCIEAGAEDYLEKPVDPVLLSCRVSACLERQRWRKQETSYLKEIEFQRDRADTLLSAMLPRQVIDRLQAGETVIADRFDTATILFADIVDFTKLTTRIDPSDLIAQLSAVFHRFDDIALAHGVEKIKTIGDAYMIASGIPEPCDDHAQRMLSAARDMLDAMNETDAGGLKLRIGIHSGPVIAGLIGRMRFVYDVWGKTVNLASRLEASGEPGRIQMSLETHGLLGRPEPSRVVTQDLKGIGMVQTRILGGGREGHMTLGAVKCLDRPCSGKDRSSE